MANQILSQSAPSGAVINFAQSQNSHPVIAYERAFVGAILTGSYRLEHDFGLVPDDFLIPSHRAIWSGAVELLQSGSIVNADAVYTWAESKGLTAAVGGYEYVHTHLRDASPLTLDASFAVGKILDASRVRRVNEALQEAIRFISANPEMGGDEIASQVEKQIFDATQHLASVGVKSMPSLIPEYREGFRQKMALGGRPVGIPIGLGPLDEKLGGFKKGTLNGLMAAPGMGKSAFMLSAVGYFAQRKVETVIFSLEMPSESLLDRVVSAHGGIPLEDVCNGNPDVADDFFRTLNDLNQGDTIHMGDAPSMTLQQISSELRRLKSERGRIDIVWIDHLHIIERGSMDYAGFLAVTKGLKQLALELDCAIIGLLHLNAGIASRQDKRPQTSDIKFLADGDFDVIFGLYRDDVYDKESEEKGLAEVLIRKYRNGKTGTAKVRYVGEMTKFEPVFEQHQSDNIILPWEVAEKLKERGYFANAALNPTEIMDEPVEFQSMPESGSEGLSIEEALYSTFGGEQYPESYPMPDEPEPISQPPELPSIDAGGVNDLFGELDTGKAVIQGDSPDEF
jgi:replicative DNA helicase